MLEAEYKEWLIHEGYQQSTIEAGLPSTLVAEQKWSKAPVSFKATSAQKPLLRRYSRFLHELPRDKWSPFDHFVVKHFDPVRPGAQLGSSTKEPLNVAQWRALVQILASSTSPIDKALLFVVHVATLEAGAVLVLPLDRLSTYLPSSLRGRLKSLQALSYASLSDYVSESERSAYVRVHRRLQQLGAQLGFDVDFRCILRTPAEVRASVFA